MVKKTVLTTHNLTIVRHFRDLIKKGGIPVERLIVFGSHAKGNAKPWSDIDVCVISPLFGKNRHTERVHLMRMRDDATLDVEPHPYSGGDLQNTCDPLATEIRRFGITVS